MGVLWRFNWNRPNQGCSGLPLIPERNGFP